MTIATFYPSANPQTFERDVTDPIEDAIKGISRVRHIQSTSAANQSVVMVEFEFGEDIEEAEKTIQSHINGVTLPNQVDGPVVKRIGIATMPVLQLSVAGDDDLVTLGRTVDDAIIPRIEQVAGVSRTEIIGGIDEQVQVILDTDKLDDLGLSMVQVVTAINRNNASIPAGDIDNWGQSYPVLTIHELGSLEDIRILVIGYEGISSPLNLAGADGKRRAIRIKDVAGTRLGTSDASAIWRIDGKPGMGIQVFKNTDYDTVGVTSRVLEAIETAKADFPHLEFAVMKDDGADAREQLGGLARDGLLGFLLAVVVVFLFLLNLRPSVVKGMVLALRSNMVIAISIPLSVLLGILMLTIAGQTLNFMTIAGLAITVGRLVDDSIVVLGNIYSHLQRGEEGLRAAYEATREVAAAVSVQH